MEQPIPVRQARKGGDEAFAEIEFKGINTNTPMNNIQDVALHPR